MLTFSVWPRPNSGQCSWRFILYKPKYSQKRSSTQILQSISYQSDAVTILWLVACNIAILIRPTKRKTVTVWFRPPDESRIVPLIREKKRGEIRNPEITGWSGKVALFKKNISVTDHSLQFVFSDGITWHVWHCSRVRRGNAKWAQKFKWRRRLDCVRIWPNHSIHILKSALDIGVFSKNSHVLPVAKNRLLWAEIGY